MKGYETGLLAAIIAVVAYTFYSLPLSMALINVGLAVIAYTISESKEVAVGLLVLSIAWHMSHNSSPAFQMASEGFQTKTPESIHARLETVKEKAPLAPKVETVTGVLESPGILDNTPLQAMDELVHEGVPGKSIPASAKARVIINPPPETSIPAPSEKMYQSVKENPYLHSGQDRLAQEVSLAQKGTDIYAQDASSDVAGVSSGAGPAF